MRLCASVKKVLPYRTLASKAALADTAIDQPKWQRYNRPPVTDGKSSFYKNDNRRMA
jgi:hypothetical protein